MRPKKRKLSWEESMKKNATMMSDGFMRDLFRPNPLMRMLKGEVTLERVRPKRSFR